jgi:hypothetical protein
MPEEICFTKVRIALWEIFAFCATGIMRQTIPRSGISVTACAAKSFESFSSSESYFESRSTRT